MQKRMEPTGFTLLEVLVSLAIMAIAVTMISQLFSANLRSVANSEDMTSAVIRAESRMRDLTSGNSLSEKVLNENTDDGYRFDISITEILKDRTDNLPVKLMKIDLTIRWIAGMKEKNFNLKTIKMIDKAAESEKEGVR
ncbi:MAG: prepilin-type N-terminal cleavage/methylation domain-containing protein [Smithella sp.]